MKKLNIKRLFCLVLITLSITATAQEVRTFNFNHEGKNGIRMAQQTRSNVSFEYSIDEMSLTTFTYKGEEMQAISISDISLPNEKGMPNVPTFSRAVAIPQGAHAVLHVRNYEQEIIKDVNLEPSLGIQAEAAEPNTDYIKDMKVYSENAFYPNEFASVSAPSQMRGVDIVNISISPVRFNPVTKEAIVYHNIDFDIEFVGGNGQFGDNRLRSPYFDPILEQNIVNYSSLPVIDYEARMQQWLRDGEDGAEYIIVIPNNDDFVAPANRLRDYRMQQGILTEVIRLDEMPATTTQQMKDWFHNAYNTWNIAPVAVLLFGDHNTNMAQGIPAIVVPHSYSGQCITDIQYADVTGDDLPEMVFSRLVAANGTEATMMADKQIEYEYTNPNMDPNFYTSPITALGWQTERWFQLCSEIFGGYMRNRGYTPQRINCIYQGTPGSSWSTADNTQYVTSYFGPSGINYIPESPAELGGWTGGTPEQVVQAVNNGAFWLQHRDHGYNEGWGEPAVNNSHIDQMNNVGKMPFVMSINCQTGQFDYTGSNGNCFAEKWMRRTYNGQNAGAVGVLCPTEVSYSFVNDAFVWGVYDQFDPDFMPTLPNNTNTPAYAYRGNWRPAFGNVAGKYFLQETSWPKNPEDKDITYIMFTAHCDAFLRIFTQVPQTMAVNHQSEQLAGLNQFQITAPAGTTIALTKGEGENMEIVAVATATGSMQTMDILPQVPPTVLHLTVTGQDYLRYEADITVIPSEGPYIIINNYELSDEATQLNFGEEAGFNIQLKNVGNSIAPAGTMTLTSDSEYVTIVNGSIDFSDITSSEIIDLNNAFRFTVSDEVPNKTNISFHITINSGDAIYENNITMKAFAPVFAIGDVTFTEISGNGNGRLDPGETYRLRFPIENKGNADSRLVVASLLFNNEYIHVLSNPVATLNSINAGGTSFVEYEIYIGNAPTGTQVIYSLTASSGFYAATRLFTATLALADIENFESGTVNPDIWNNDQTYPWTICDTNPYEGLYCLKSGTISHSQQTILSTTQTATNTDTIAFYYKVSCEGSSSNPWDKLTFLIDGSERDVWSGTIAWSYKEYQITPGTHTFTWKYSKDSSVSSGDDCTWIDFVKLPHDYSLRVVAGLDVEVCAGGTAQLEGIATNSTSVAWTTTGDGIFSDATILDPVYTPGTQDLATGSATLILTGNKGSESQSDTLTMTIVSEPVVIGDNLINVTSTDPVELLIAIENYDLFIGWETDGTGSFTNPYEIQTTYVPTDEDFEATDITLTAKYTGCGGMQYEYAVRLHFSHLNVTNPDAAVLRIHPNPANNVVNITIDNITSKVEMTLFNSVGQMVCSQIESAENGLNTVMNIGDLSDGMYILQIRSDNDIWTKKIIKR